ncbi:MAG: hypothetical protein JO372_25030 [Solirubrobacterales bacterium]|nr:hypothetical protein [Solirubrobacterales bacterium]
MKERNRKDVLEAMDRLFAGRPLRSNGNWTITQLAAESGVSRPTINRDPHLKAVFAQRKTEMLSRNKDEPAAGATAAAARLRDAEARWGQERQKLRHKNEILAHAVEVLAHRVRDLHEELVRLQREHAAGNVTPIRFRAPF